MHELNAAHSTGLEMQAAHAALHEEYDQLQTNAKKVALQATRSTQQLDQEREMQELQRLRSVAADGKWRALQGDPFCVFPNVRTRALPCRAPPADWLV